MCYKVTQNFFLGLLDERALSVEEFNVTLAQLRLSASPMLNLIQLARFDCSVKEMQL